MTTVYKAHKVRLYPNLKQQKQIDVTIHCRRFLYNKMLEERKSVYEQLKDDKKQLRAHKYRTEKEYKQEFEFLKEANSRALQCTRVDLDAAYKNFFRELKKGKVCYPQFKSRHKSRMSYRDPQVGGFIEIKDSKIKLLKLGFVKLRGLPESFNGKICSVTVSKDRMGQYFASILVELELPKKQRKVDGIVGVDLGLKEFVTCSNGDQYHGIKEELKSLDKKIEKQHKYLSRKENGSKRKEKSRVKLARMYQHKTRVQDHFHWHMANKICGENQTVVLEDLCVKGMMRNRSLARSIGNASWSKFVVKLEQKAVEYGTEVHKIHRFYPSSKLCSSCGSLKQDLKLSDRTYECDCGLRMDRDLNAAINIKMSLESSDYSRGEALRPIKFHLCGSFEEAMTEEVVAS